MIRWTKLGVAVAALALVGAGSASAASPYQFTNRAAFERSVASNFPKVVRGKWGRVRVLSVGCAKNGIGRAACAVVADSSRFGTKPYAYTVTCADDRGKNCTAAIDNWPR